MFLFVIVFRRLPATHGFGWLSFQVHIHHVGQGQTKVGLKAGVSHFGESLPGAKNDGGGAGQLFEATCG